MFADIVYAMGQGGAAQQGGQGSGLMGLAPLVIIFVIFYFLLIRPQQKKAKEQQQMINSLKKDDLVITNGGIYGRLTAVDETTVTVEIADRVRIKLSRQSIVAKRAAETPVKTEKSEKK